VPHGGDARVLMMVSFGPTQWREGGMDPMLAALHAAGILPADAT
jgi:hypothetical protein